MINLKPTKIVMAISSLLIAGSAFATAQTPAPVCPTADQLRPLISFTYGEVTGRRISDNGNYYVFDYLASTKPITLDNVKWGVIGKFSYDGVMRADQIMDTASYYLSTALLSYQPTATWDANKNIYECVYTSAHAYISISAVSPPPYGFAAN